MVVEPTAAPCKSAFAILATSCSPARCCGRSPGLDRAALMFVTRTGRPAIAARAAVFLRIWPPPSSMLPDQASCKISCA